MHKGKILKELIKQSPYTQKEVAKGIGLHEGYFSVQLKDPDVKTQFVNQVCEFLGVTPDDHFKGKKEEDSQGKYQELYEKHLASIMEHNEEKSRWLIEKEKLVDEKKSLQDELIRLQQKIVGLEQELGENKRVG